MKSTGLNPSIARHFLIRKLSHAFSFLPGIFYICFMIRKEIMVIIIMFTVIFPLYGFVINVNAHYITQDEINYDIILMALCKTLYILNILRSNVPGTIIQESI